MEKKRILIISGEAWQDNTNGGNVLTNLFGSMSDCFEYAQIYCNQNLPNNAVCKHYFHLSEAEILKAFFTRKPLGHKLTEQEFRQAEVCPEIPDTPLAAWARKLRFDIFYTLQDCMFYCSYWKTPALDDFIRQFNPDIVFAPLYYRIHMHLLDRYVSRLTGKKLVSYVSDDYYSYRQFSLSPVYWFNRWVLHKNIEATSKYIQLLYTMTREQLNEYRDALQVPMKILRKAANFDDTPPFKTTPNIPLKLLYGGNLIYNRWKTIAQIINALRSINRNEVLIQLYIYSQTPLTKRMQHALHDGRNSFFMGKVSAHDLEVQQATADILLHVESFDLRQRLVTRLSFSTKLVDLMHSARCIVAICWKESSPYKYLHTQDAAICIDHPSRIKNVLLRLLYNPTLLNTYAYKAWACGKRNHNKKEIIENLKNELCAIH